MRRPAPAVLPAVLPAASLALAAACSSPEESGASPAMPDEQRALAEAEAMIPAAERPSPTATESTADGQ